MQKSKQLLIFAEVFTGLSMHYGRLINSIRYEEEVGGDESPGAW